MGNPALTTHTFDQGQDAVAALAQHFANNRAAYHEANYKEAHARQEFIDPFFAALGWDVQNAHHLPPNTQEVLVEDSLEMAGQKKAPDYVFRVGRAGRGREAAVTAADRGYGSAD